MPSDGLPVLATSTAVNTQSAFPVANADAGSAHALRGMYMAAAPITAPRSAGDDGGAVAGSSSKVQSVPAVVANAGHARAQQLSGRADYHGTSAGSDRAGSASSDPWCVGRPLATFMPRPTSWTPLCGMATNAAAGIYDDGSDWCCLPIAECS